MGAWMPVAGSLVVSTCSSKVASLASEAGAWAAMMVALLESLMALALTLPPPTSETAPSPSSASDKDGDRTS